jgi:hypothetical protein
MTDLDRAIAQAKTEVTADVKAGRVPRSVASFSELHDHVDANEYGGLTDERADFDLDFANALQTAVDEWIKGGGLVRTILVHLNVEVDADDPRNADEIGDLVLAALEVGMEGAPGDLASGNSLDGASERVTITAPLVEEV